MQFSYIKKFKLTTFFQAFFVITIATTAGYALYAQTNNAPSLAQTNLITITKSSANLLGTSFDTHADFSTTLDITQPAAVNTTTAASNQNKTVATAPQENSVVNNNTSTTTTVATDNKNTTVAASPEEPTKKTITVQLKASGPNVSYNAKIEVTAGSTVQTVMNTAKQQGFRYSVSQNSSLGAFVESIQGVSTNKDTEMYWIYRVNGALAIAGISSYVIKSGDVISWTYEKSY